MLQRDNVLILDEPTNHLDIDSKEMLEQALQHFEGTILFVSHDRYFINQLANKVFDLTIDGGKMYLGDYQYYIEKVEEAEALKAHQEEQSVNVQAHKSLWNNRRIITKKNKDVNNANLNDKYPSVKMK